MKTLPRDDPGSPAAEIPSFAQAPTDPHLPPPAPSKATGSEATGSDTSGAAAASSEAASSVAAGSEVSPLRLARLRRKLTVEETAERAGLTPEAVEALEQSRLYRFASQRQAIAAAILYSSALGISEREARQLAGLPVHESLIASRPRTRIAAALAFVAAAVLLAWFVIVPRFGDKTSPAEVNGATLLPAPALEASLPEPWEIEVDVLNGSTVGRTAARLADRIAGLSYDIREVTNAPRRDYPETRVYFAPGSAGIAERLAEELGVATQELPGGDEPRRLVVIAGAEAPLD